MARPCGRDSARIHRTRHSQRRRHIRAGTGLGALLLSNPANPTGQHVRGEDLSEYVRICRDLRCALVTLCIGGGMGVAMCVERA